MSKNNLIIMYDLIMQNGGASYQIETGQLNPTTGFMVSLPGNERIVDIPRSVNKWQNVVTDYLLAKSKEGPTIVGMLVDNVDLYLGAWIENDKLYLDISEKVENFDIAENLGYERNQRAIYDNVNQQSFYL